MVERQNGYLSFGAVFLDPLPHDPQSRMVVTRVNTRGSRVIDIVARRIFYGPSPDRSACIGLRSQTLSPNGPKDIIAYWTAKGIVEAAKRSCEINFRGCADEKFRESQIKTALARLDLEIYGTRPKPKPKPIPKLTDPENPSISRATRARWLKN